MPTEVSAPLPDVTLASGSTITVTLSDASTLVTALNVYGVSPTTGLPLPVIVVEPLFAYASTNGTEAPGHTP